MSFKNINIVCEQDMVIQRLQYTVDFINNHPLKPKDVKFSLNSIGEADMVIFYGDKREEQYHIPFQNLIFRSDAQVDSDLFINEYLLQDSSVFSVEPIQSNVKDFCVDFEFGFDIFETIFFHISRYEECHYKEVDLDEHRRMKMEVQLLYKNNLHKIPVVDHLIFAFFKAIGLEVATQKTTHSLTHDIDIIEKYGNILRIVKSFGRAIIDLYPIRDFLSISKTIFKSFFDKSKDPYYTFDWLFSDSNTFKNKIVFFVLGGKTRFDLYSSFYDKELPRVIEMAKKKSYKIGFHPSYNAYNSFDMYLQESDKLQGFTGDKIENVRSHFLRLDLQDTFEIIEKLGFKSDSTLGFANTIGFRCGTGFEYRPYNFKDERAWEFTELPLVFMDSALFFQECNSDITCFKEKLKEFIDSNSYNTHITFNFHNTTFDNTISSRKGLKSIYLSMINSI